LWRHWTTRAAFLSSRAVRLFVLFGGIESWFAFQLLSTHFFQYLLWQAEPSQIRSGSVGESLSSELLIATVILWGWWAFWFRKLPRKLRHSFRGWHLFLLLLEYVFQGFTANLAWRTRWKTKSWKNCWRTFMPRKRSSKNPHSYLQFFDFGFVWLTLCYVMHR
jgi:hypothetical protein